jgi:hypothetical protein
MDLWRLMDALVKHAHTRLSKENERGISPRSRLSSSVAPVPVAAIDSWNEVSMNFVGRTLALDSSGLNNVAAALKVAPPKIWAVLHVETAQCGFLPDRRPSLLFERHIFHKLTNGAFDRSHPNISNPVAGGYGAPGANQYTRLSAAMALNSDAALQSTSWGIGQVLGEYFQLAGFSDVQSMVSAIIDSEGAQLTAFCAYLQSTNLADPLQASDWASFARGYNGPNYAKNCYDTQLSAAFQRFNAGPLPDLNVRAAQLYLTLKGFSPGGIDGMAGPDTTKAVLAFQESVGLPQTGELDDPTMSALTPPLPPTAPAGN